MLQVAPALATALATDFTAATALAARSAVPAAAAHFAAAAAAADRMQQRLRVAENLLRRDGSTGGLGWH